MVTDKQDKYDTGIFSTTQVVDYQQVMDNRNIHPFLNSELFTIIINHIIIKNPRKIGNWEVTRDA